MQNRPIKEAIIDCTLVEFDFQPGDRVAVKDSSFHDKRPTGTVKSVEHVSVDIDWDEEFRGHLGANWLPTSLELLSEGMGVRIKKTYFDVPLKQLQRIKKSAVTEEASRILNVLIDDAKKNGGFVLVDPEIAKIIGYQEEESEAAAS